MAEFIDGDGWEEIVEEIILPSRLVRASNFDHTDTFNVIADQFIRAGQLIYLDDDVVRVATVLDGRLTGMSVEDAQATNECHYITRGIITLETWFPITGQNDLIPGRNYFLKGDGQLDIEPAKEGYCIQVGQAQTHRTLDVQIGPRIKLL